MQNVSPVVQWNKVEIGDLDRRPKLKHNPKTQEMTQSHDSQYEVVV